MLMKHIKKEIVMYEDKRNELFAIKLQKDYKCMSVRNKNVKVSCIRIQVMYIYVASRLLTILFNRNYLYNLCKSNCFSCLFLVMLSVT